jgi:LuxR family transcriptional regulator, glucitol operon activator
LIQALGRHRGQLPAEINWRLKQTLPQLERLLGIRNRVMHSRPLNFDDLAITTHVAESLAGDRSWDWRELKTALQTVEQDPGSVLRLAIPRADDDDTFHNLPTPDFDETGFIGRKAIIEQVTKALLGPFPVVTIVGEGGVGKTALALKVAYDILDNPDHPFDAVVFTTAKTTQLTVAEIRRIEQAITTSVGLFTDVASQLAGEPSDNPFDDILEQLRDFRVLLVLDNLETVLDDRIRSFLGALPQGSKVFITSRIGVGAFEYPIRLGPLQNDEAVQLLRAVARARGVDSLTRVGNKQLAAFCERMRNNPLHIKWFVAAVHSGRRPEEILSNEKIFLEFCLSNVYDFLTGDSRRVLRALLSLGGKYTLAELAYVTELNDLLLQVAIQQLATTNMMEMSTEQSGASFETKYSMSPLARAYLTKLYPLTRSEQEEFVTRKRQLMAAGEEIVAGLERGALANRQSIHVRSRSDWVVAKFLREAYTRAKHQDFAGADESLARARNLAPGYFEVYRVGAEIDALQNNLAEAGAGYEAAIDLEPNSAPLRFAYASFLVREMQDIESALPHITLACDLDPGAADIRIERTRYRLYARRFDEAAADLAELDARSDLSEKEKQKLLDLHISFHQRRADYCATHNEPLEAIRELRELRDAFRRVPQPDEKMRHKLDKSILTARQCLNQAAGPDQSAISMELLQWLSRECSVRDTNVELTPGQSLTGTIRELPLHERFGFIQPDAGPALFFHKSSLKNRDSWSRLAVGQRVEFVVGENPGGLCATVVEATTSLPKIPSADRGTGELVRLRVDKGFGFLRSDEGPEYFFHRTAIVPLGDWYVLNEGDRMTFNVEKDSLGRPKAIGVRRH